MNVTGLLKNGMLKLARDEKEAVITEVLNVEDFDESLIQIRHG